LPKVFPKDMDANEVSCLTVLLGANDANSPQSPSNQFVPIDEYENNLIEIINYLESIGIQKERLILISPPTYYHKDFLNYCKLNGRLETIKDNATVGKYAIACGSAAQRTGVDFLNIYESFSNQKDGQKLFCDGLHFSREGSQLLFDLIWPLVEKKVKLFRQSSELIMNFPIYSDINIDCPEKSLLQ
jgi:lysophospholipase L1-like esterase